MIAGQPAKRSSPRRARLGGNVGTRIVTSLRSLDTAGHHREHTPRQITIYEPLGTGHRFEYVAQLIVAAGSDGRQVRLLTTREAMRENTYYEHIVPLRNLVEVRAVSARTVVGCAQAMFSSRRDTYVDLDCDTRVPCILALTLLRVRPVQIGALMMRPPWRSEMTAKQRIKARLWATLGARPRVVTAVLADCFGDLPNSPSRARHALVADRPVLHVEPEAELNLVTCAPDAPLRVLVAGVIDARKAPDVVLAAAAGSNIEVDIVGSLSPHLRNILAGHPNARVIDRFVSDIELDEAITRADVVSVVLRSQTGSSGMLGRAICYGKPVIAGGNETVAIAVAKRNVGVVAHALTPVAIREALANIAANYEDYAAHALLARQKILQHPILGRQVLTLLSAD